MIETRASQSIVDETTEELRRAAFRTPMDISGHRSSASSIPNFGMLRMPDATGASLLQMMTPPSASGYTVGSFADLVQHAVEELPGAVSRVSYQVFLEARPKGSANAAIEALARNPDFTHHFRNTQDLLLFTSMLQQYPELLDRSQRLLAMVSTSEQVESASIEVDVDDGRVLVWTHLNVEDRDRLQVQMKLFSDGERILGALADVVRLAMI